MSLFIAIPIAPSDIEPLSQVARAMFGDSGVINWFEADGFHHVTLAYTSGTETEEQNWINRFRSDDWMPRLTASRLRFELVLTQFERFGNGEVIVLTAPRSNRQQAFQSLALASWRCLKWLRYDRTPCQRPLIRPHVSLGKIQVGELTARNSIYDLPSGRGNTVLRLPVASVALFQKRTGTPSRQYDIVEIGRLDSPLITQMAP
jgi:2'-5' RNA ligase